MKRRLRLAALALALVLLASSAPALADTHDPRRSGHPVRLAAYVLHPVGVLLDTLIMRPAHWFVHLGPNAQLFGHEEGE